MNEEHMDISETIEVRREADYGGVKTLDNEELRHAIERTAELLNCSPKMDNVWSPNSNKAEEILSEHLRALCTAEARRAMTIFFVPKQEA